MCRTPDRHSREQREATEKLVDELLEQVIISRSPGAWVSPITTVIKGEGSSRFCVNFREASQRLSVPKYPIRCSLCYSKNVPLHGGVRAQEAFNKLKKALVSSFVLAHPDLDKPFTV